MRARENLKDDAFLIPINCTRIRIFYLSVPVSGLLLKICYLVHNLSLEFGSISYYYYLVILFGSVITSVIANVLVYGSLEISLTDILFALMSLVAELFG